jgi:hypothetical protein
VAKTPPTTSAQDWATPFNRLEELNLYLDQAPAHERDAVEREIAALHDDLLDTPAPTLTAVRQKLEMIWEGEMHGLDQASEERRLVIEDLEGLIDAQRQLLGQ